MQLSPAPQGLFAAQCKFPLLQKHRQVKLRTQHSEDETSLPSMIGCPKTASGNCDRQQKARHEAGLIEAADVRLLQPIG
jgi:hypothetical protein